MTIPVAINGFFDKANFEEPTDRDECKNYALQCYNELKEANKLKLIEEEE
jgi:hypothetical protein